MSWHTIGTQETETADREKYSDRIGHLKLDRFSCTMEDTQIEDDIDVAVAIFLEALSFRPHISRAPLGEHFQTLTLQQLLTETLTPRVQVLYLGPDGRLPCLFFRFVGDEFPIIEAIFNPIEAILSFLAEGRNHIQDLRLTERTEDDKERLARKMAVEMTLIMIDSFYPRSQLMMHSYSSEVIAQWHIHYSKNARYWTAQRGESLPTGETPWLKVLADKIRVHARELSRFWKLQLRLYQGGDKIRFAVEYKTLYKHWKFLGKISSNENWREYAINKRPDTPNDLLDQFEHADRKDESKVRTTISELALEHAARKAGILKIRGVSEAIRKQRKAGIPVSGYTSGQLFEFLKEGEELIAKQDDKQGRS